MTPPADNPLLAPWTTPFGLPPFAAIRPAHFAPAFDAALAAHRAEIDAIAAATEPPTLDNTVAAFDRSGRDLVRIQRLFYNLAASETSPELQAVEREMAPRLAAHHSAIYMTPGSSPASTRCTGSVRSSRRTPSSCGCSSASTSTSCAPAPRSPPPPGNGMAAIARAAGHADHAVRQNVLADEAAYQLVLDDASDLAGLPEGVVAAAGAAARQRNLAVGWVITLSRSLVVPVPDLLRPARPARAGLPSLDPPRRARRRARQPPADRARSSRCGNEQARLHGYASYADYALADTMAGTPAAVAKLLDAVWEPACRKAAAECRALAEFARSLWRHAPDRALGLALLGREGARDALRARRRRSSSPTSRSTRMVAGGVRLRAAPVRHRLRSPRPDLPVYHPDVRAYEVRDRDGRPIGVFLPTTSPAPPSAAARG